MNRRKKGFFSVENIAKTIIIFTVVLVVLSFVGYGVLGFLLATKPEIFGGWIGEFLNSIISNVDNGGE